MIVMFSKQEQLQIKAIAEKLDILPIMVESRLANVYLANFEEDLKWVEEMFEEDKEN